MYKTLTNKIYFPDVNLVDEHGILAMGGDLSTERLLLAYRSGIFPWYNKGEPIVWYSPKNRMVLFPNEIKISKSMRKVLSKKEFSVTFNTNFEFVINACKQIRRKDQDGTWITDEMHQAYLNLHHLGYAKSIEVWKDNKIVGGLYGIDLGGVFCGESMFSSVSNASKVAFISLAKMDYKLIDCQVYNTHLASLGAREVSKNKFNSLLKKYIIYEFCNKG
jgi:leucyl/phenylalanyl-tRNA--protein transferase